MSNYSVTLLGDSGEILKNFSTKNAKTAINKWIMWSAKRPTMAAIQCGSKESKELLDYAKKHIDEIMMTMVRYRLDRYYKLDILKQRIMNAKPNKSYENKYMDYDQVAVFCYG